MTDDGASSPTGRPLCRCHGLPMRRVGGRNAHGWRCSARDDYARMRRALRARIALKRAHVEELEERLREHQA